MYLMNKILEEKEHILLVLEKDLNGVKITSIIFGMK